MGRMFTVVVRIVAEQSVNEEISFPQKRQSDSRSSGTVIPLPAEAVWSSSVMDSEAWDLRVRSGDPRRWCL